MYLIILLLISILLMIFATYIAASNPRTNHIFINKIEYYINLFGVILVTVNIPLFILITALNDKLLDYALTYLAISTTIYFLILLGIFIYNLITNVIDSIKHFRNKKH